MTLQTVFSTIFIAGWAVAFCAGLIGFCQRVTGRKYGRTMLFFLSGWVLAAAAGLLALALGYHP